MPDKVARNAVNEWRVKEKNLVKAREKAIWTAWNQVYTLTTSCTSATGNDVIWNAWNHGYASTSCTSNTITATTNDVTWQIWNNQYVEILNRQHQTLQRAIAAQQAAETPAQRAERERQRVERETYYAQQNAEIQRAKERAEKLLVENLTPEQLQSIKDKGYFEVSVAGRTFRIQHGRGQHGNVIEVDAAGKSLYSYCIQPREHVPDGDALLAQKLMIETDIESFTRIANRTRH